MKIRFHHSIAGILVLCFSHIAAQDVSVAKSKEQNRTTAGQAVGIFENHGDIGKPKNTGTVTCDDVMQTYTLKGSGDNIWFNHDQFQYAYKKLKGDFILTANFEFVGAGVNHHRKIGWMVRASADSDAVHYSAVLHGDGLTVLQWRLLKGAFMRDPEDELFTSKKNFTILQLERTGKKIIFRAAHAGEPLQAIGTVSAETLPDEALAGIFICSHDGSVMEEARVFNVRIEKPVSENYDAYSSGFLGSRLEILTIADGRRRVIHEYKGRFEAPNWMPDGKKLLFNQEGSLYTIPVGGGQPEKFATGNLDQNNNDHGISFDGKMLAVSHHQKDFPGGGSAVYVMPLSGGTPKMITAKTPSYFHGWAPNGKELLFIGSRDAKNFDVYKIGINGGEEIRLTASNGTHVDGAEYSPDGNYIYYNGNSSGTMQLWRMKPDGSGKEQLTFDEYNNWFPHLSPDGKWIVYISFLPDIDVDDHPFYKRVMLRLMPVGGNPRTIAYLYGGQGTMNVPSWSPDSKSVAFVSNSGL